MDRQKIYDNFVTALDGKGQALDGASCVYFKDGHPGCGIGCQPGFRERFETITPGSNKRRFGDNESIDVIWSEVREFFGSTDDGSEDGDLGFMMAIQTHHDDEENWDGDNLRKARLKEFREEHDLAATN